MMWLLSNRLGSAFVVVSLTAGDLMAAGGWVVDAKSGCKVWNPNPQAGEAAVWSGPCVDGFAQGRGALQWLLGGVPIETDEGEWGAGRQLGVGTQTWSTGSYQGALADGVPEGLGIMTMQGRRYEGEFRNGKPDGVGTLTVDGRTYQGSWRQGCLSDGKVKAAFGVVLASCH